jgi:hypothetical protein
MAPRNVPRFQETAFAREARGLVSTLVKAQR